MGAAFANPQWRMINRGGLSVEALPSCGGGIEGAPSSSCAGGGIVGAPSSSCAGGGIVGAPSSSCAGGGQSARGGGQSACRDSIMFCRLVCVSTSLFFFGASYNGMR